MQEKLLTFVSDGRFSHHDHQSKCIVLIFCISLGENVVAGSKSGFGTRLEEKLGISLVKTHW